MLRYRLDDLGWFHFEALTQSLLKADLGLDVEAWGGHGDRGRDAYREGSLFIAGREVAGPFVFQAKFVNGANAAGAEWAKPLLGSVRKEATLIRRRRGADPAQYFLLTNSPVDAAARAEIAKILGRATKAAVTVLGAGDLSAMLERHPELRRSFPEILSHRDVEEILRDALNRGVSERSRIALAEARDLLPVFVPTQAYDRTWRTLEKHDFAVLDGPPEMGKTAIARMVSFGHHLEEWEVIDCRGPDDVFDAYVAQRKQIFVADDAFGRTEFDPLKARAWEHDLPRVFQRIDQEHRLIWTTRKHILERALQEMDLTGKARRFPDPGEILVTADALTVEEKARIVYRHAKKTDEAAREHVRTMALALVCDPHFTPERIRRLVDEELPKLVARGSPERELWPAMIVALQKPTAGMRLSFQKLSRDHQLVLLAVLKMNGAATPAEVYEQFAKYTGESRVRFARRLDDLIGTFLRHSDESRVSWIHPSYRDLVIDELMTSHELRHLFLQHATINGLALAVSQAGGEKGERSFPLLRDPASIALFRERAATVANERAEDTALLSVLHSAYRANVPDGVADALRDVVVTAGAARARQWHRRGEQPSASELSQFFQTFEFANAEPPLPPIARLWDEECEILETSLREGRTPAAHHIIGWSHVRELIETYYRDFAASREVHVRAAAIEGSLLAQLDYDASLSPDQWMESGDARTEYQRLAHLAMAVAPFSEALEQRLESAAEEFLRYVEPEIRECDDLDDDDAPVLATSSFDLAAFFSDL